MTEIDEGILKALVEDAARKGAQQALDSIGLHDAEAVHDVKELRDLLSAWRSTKKTVGSTIVKAITVFILGAIAAGTSVHLLNGAPK